MFLVSPVLTRPYLTIRAMLTCSSAPFTFITEMERPVLVVSTFINAPALFSRRNKGAISCTLRELRLLPALAGGLQFARRQGGTKQCSLPAIKLSFTPK